MKKFLTIILFSPLTFASGSMLDGFQITPSSAGALGTLGVDTNGDYVSNITAADGISTTGAATGETISHDISVDQTFDFTLTGDCAFTPSGTQDLHINTDADSLLYITGLSPANGSALCSVGSDAVGTCADATFTGNITANNFSGTSSGTNTGDQTITLTGDVTGSGTGSFAATISANAVALGTDTTGNYVGTLTAGTGISTTGAATGEGIAHSVSVDQSFAPTWTGAHTWYGVGNYTAQTFILDHNGDPSTRKSTTVYTTTGMTTGDLSAINFVLVDTANSTGGQVSNVNCQMIPTGDADFACMFAGAGVYPVVAAAGSPPAAPSKAWIQTTGPAYTDTTTAFGSAGTDVQIFVNDNDYIYVGEATTFFEIQVLLQVASSANIAAIFQYWNGSTWVTFAPNDGTAGFTRNGNITFNKDTLITGGWTTTSVNGVSKYYIRIQRTQNTIATPPTEDTIILSDGIQNQWDPDGRVSVQNVTTLGSGTNKFAGSIQLTTTVTVLPTCNADNLLQRYGFDDGANRIYSCECQKTGASTYAWVKSGGGSGC